MRLALQVGARDRLLVDTALALPAGPVPGWSSLAATADALLRDVGPARDDRERWLAGQLAALATTCHGRAGRRLPWTERVERCLGVRPELGPVQHYDAAHDRLEALLPGPGPLLDRLAAHVASTVVPPERLLPALTAVVALLRARTPGVPDDERLRLDVLSGAPWSARCRALGPRRSVVVVDRARSLPAASLVALAAHETYPGHHHERCLLDGQPEREVAVLLSPESVVTEGLGEAALRASGVTVAECGPLLGQDLELADAVGRAAAPLLRTKTDAALLLHTRGPEVAARHLRRWGLHTPARVAAQLRFLTDPVHEVHAVAYGAGAALVGGWLDAGGRYADLLGRPVTPALLAAGPG